MTGVIGEAGTIGTLAPGTEPDAVKAVVPDREVDTTF